MSKIKMIMYGFLILLVGVLAGRFLTPKKTETKVQIVEKIVEKEVKKIEERIIYKKDGTKVVEKGISETVDRTEDRVVKQSKIELQDKELGLTLVVKSPITRLGTELTYGLLVEKRVLGSFWVGGYVDTQKFFGLSLGVKF